MVERGGSALDRPFHVLPLYNELFTVGQIQHAETYYNLEDVQHCQDYPAGSILDEDEASLVIPVLLWRYDDIPQCGYQNVEQTIPSQDAERQGAPYETQAEGTDNQHE